ncbi:hypothetical protein PENTCL1PPCAC_1190, partial [Pristionchus entomophagus]
SLATPFAFQLVGKARVAAVGTHDAIRCEALECLNKTLHDPNTLSLVQEVDILSYIATFGEFPFRRVERREGDGLTHVDWFDFDSRNSPPLGLVFSRRTAKRVMEKLAYLLSSLFDRYHMEKLSYRLMPAASWKDIMNKLSKPKEPLYTYSIITLVNMEIGIFICACGILLSFVAFAAELGVGFSSIGLVLRKGRDIIHFV